MARWAENRDGGRRLTNSEPVACEACGVDLAPGQGRVWRCRDGCEVEDHRAPGPRGAPVGGWHCACLDAQACRVRCTPPAPGVRDLAASARAAWRRLQEVERRSPEHEWIEALAWWTTATGPIEAAWEVAV